MIKTKIILLVKYIIGFIIRIFNLKVNIGGYKILFPKEMNIDELGSTIKGNYERHERILVNKYLKRNDAVLEMGACIGVVSLCINNILKDKTKQVSIEPNPQMHKYLYQNKLNNNGMFHVETCIISKQKEVPFFMGGSAFLGSNTLGRGEKIIVIGKTLEDITKQYFVFTAIVMDIEGGELDFFRSFDLKNSKIRLIIWETHLSPHLLSIDELNECYDILEMQGFKLKEKSSGVECWLREL